MTCIDLTPAAEVRCLDSLNMAINREITKLRVAGRPCPEVPEDAVADCDCYAERKAERLRAMGYSARTRIVYLPKTQVFHRVAEAAGRVFDNLDPRTYRASGMVSYVWLPADAQMAR